MSRTIYSRLLLCALIGASTCMPIAAQQTQPAPSRSLLGTILNGAPTKSPNASGSPARPSQTTSPNSRNAADSPRFNPTSASSQGQYTAPAPISGSENPENIVPDDVPMIPRRPLPASASNPFGSSSQASMPSSVPSDVVPTAGQTPVKGYANGSGPTTSSSNFTPNTTTAAAPSTNGTASSNGNAAAGNSASNSTQPRTLQERLAAARRNLQNNNANQTPAVDVKTDSTGSSSGLPSTYSSGRSSSAPAFNSSSSSGNSQEMVNPNASANRGSSSSEPTPARKLGDFQGELPSVLGKGPTPAAPQSTETPTSSRITSRRGVTIDAPVERTAEKSSTQDVKPLESTRSSNSNALLFSRQTPQITVETTGPRTITVGKEAVYTVTVKNSGDQASTGMSVMVRIPEFADMLDTKASNGSVQAAANVQAPAPTVPGEAVAAPVDGKPLQWQIGRVDANAKESLTIKIIPRKSMPFELGVQWAMAAASSKTVVEVQEPKLAMTINGPDDVLFGQTKIYKLTLSNPGSGDAENVMIHLSPLGEQQGPMTKHHLGNLLSGESKVIEVEMTARQAGKVVIKSQATADGGLQTEVKQEVLVRRSSLNVRAVASKTRYAGTQETFSLKVENPGNAPAENVQVIAQLPSGAKFISAINGQYNESGKITWTIPTLRAGSEQILEVKCLLNMPGENKLALSATASGDLIATDSSVTQVEALADLKLEVIEPKGPLPTGDEVTYEIHIKNRGSKSAEKIHIAGYFEEGINPTTAIGGPHELDEKTGAVLFSPLATLAPGSEATFKIKARATKPGNLIFRAEAVCEADGTKLANQSAQLFYGDEVSVASRPTLNAKQDDDINVPAALQNQGTGSSRKQPVLQAAPQTPSAQSPSAQGTSTQSPLPPVSSGLAPVGSSSSALPAPNGPSANLPMGLPPSFSPSGNAPGTVPTLPPSSSSPMPSAPMLPSTSGSPALGGTPLLPATAPSAPTSSPMPQFTPPTNDKDSASPMLPSLGANRPASLPNYASPAKPSVPMQPVPMMATPVTPTVR